MSEPSQNLDMTALLAKAQAYLDQKFPDPAFRLEALKMFSKAIRLAHSLNPNSWGINFGGNGPFLLMEHEWAFDVRAQSGEVSFHVYLKKLDETTLAKLTQNAKVQVDKADLWSQIAIRLPEQEGMVELLWPAFEAYMKDKARFKIHSSSIPSHLKRGTGLVEYIRVNGIDPTLPQPEYVNSSSKTNGKPKPDGEPGMDIILSDLVNSFETDSLSFTPWQVATFYTALQTKGFVILSGISGTGKTKLAQAFARLLPQPSTKVELPKDLIKITVQPYMLRYNRLIIPQSALEYFTPPDPGQAIQVKLKFEDKSEDCQLRHNKYSNTEYIQLLLKGKVKIWFGANFEVDSTIILEPEIDADDNLTGFKMGKPEKFSKPVSVTSDENPENYLFLSVRPDWRDSKSLFGYYNPIDQQYHSTPFLEFIKRAHDSYKRQDKLAWFVLLDEMNLARVEYYFSDLLSVMESGRDKDGWSRESIRLDYPVGLGAADYQREIKLPPNLYFIGTVNVDETTHAFSPKVLDRAFTLELTEADFSNYPVFLDPANSPMSENKKTLLLDGFTRQGRYAWIEKAEIIHHFEANPGLRDQLITLNKTLQPYDLHFGYRVVDEIAAFLANAETNSFYDDLPDGDNEPLDAAILMKILPKFHGSRTRLEEPLKTVLAWCMDSLDPKLDAIETITQDGAGTISSIIQELENQKYLYPHTARRVIRMIRSLYSTGFASFG